MIVTGRVRIRDWETEEKSGTSIEIDAEAIGHDLTWGRATFTRSVIAKSTTRDDASEASEGASAGPTEEDAVPAEETADQNRDEALAATPF